MGLFDMLSRDGRKAGALRKNLARAVNKDAQSADRMKALEMLREDGSPDAIHGILRRFSFNYDKTIEDEHEKEWVEETLIELGNERVMPSLARYHHEADSIAWPLRILAKIGTSEQIHALLQELVERNEPGYIRDPSKKIQMLHFIGEHKDARMSALLLPYLEDMDEGVRYTTVEGLLHQKNEEVAREPLLAHFAKPEEESGRIKLRIIDGFATHGWEVKGFRGTVEKALPEAYILDAKGHVKRKGQG
jgi:hypothetical protein